jgi:hypothetical protein
MSIIYAEDTFWQIESRRKKHKLIGHGMFARPHGQGEDGYGRKITTDYVVRVNDDKQWKRVYCTCFSNNGSVWFTRKGVQYHFRIDDLLKTNGVWPQEWIRCPKPSASLASSETSDSSGPDSPADSGSPKPPTLQP